jgi:hypothetical protein
MRRRFARKFFGRAATAACLVAIPLIANPSPAAASVTIGQLAPGSSPPAICTHGPVDITNPTVTSGNTYVVPVAGTITSWSTNAAAGAGQMLKMKVFRHIAGFDYTVVGHAGPHALTGSALNTFPASIPVQPGDVLGLNDVNAGEPNNACLFSTLGGTEHLEHSGDLADGVPGAFAGPYADQLRANVTAVLVPGPATTTNTFTFGLPNKATLRGNKLLLKIKCPKEASPNACEYVLRGLAKGKKSKRATAKKKVTIKAGNKKKVKIKVKPKFLARYQRAKKVFVKAKVQAGTVTATLVKKMKLIHKR